MILSSISYRAPSYTSPIWTAWTFRIRRFHGRNRARNTAYGLRVMTNPNTSNDDKQAMAEVVNENPGLFFKNAGGGRRQG